MATRTITADQIFTGTELIPNGLIRVDEEGFIVAIETHNPKEKDRPDYFPGLLTPGFINAHCHLELSHMIDKVATGTGLLPFLKQVVAFRGIDPTIIQEAIVHHDQAMYDQGIVAVGDICNTTDTLMTKQKSSIHYHSFIEMFDFMQDSMTEKTIDQYLPVYEAFQHANLIASASPHAPYTVSKKLYERINLINNTPSVVSIHNQETSHEDALFLNGGGGFAEFFTHFGIDFSFFNPTKISSLQSAIPHLDSSQTTLFVHNTMTTEEDIQFAQSWNKKSYWVTCPNANLYIENRLPNYQEFLDNDAMVAIGTDSLTSNWQLSILEEIKTIAKYCSYVPTVQLLQWATYNGARALSMDDQLGSLTQGKKPGIVWIDTSSLSPLDLCQASRAQRVDN